jgi:hypothetical protein
MDYFFTCEQRSSAVKGDSATKNFRPSVLYHMCIYVDYTCSHHIWKFYLEEGLLIIECVLLKGSQ